MSSGKPRFYQLPRIHQRALHELYLNRHDSNFVVSEETKLFLLLNQSIVVEELNLEFERESFTKDSYSQFTDSSGAEILLYQEAPPTPPLDNLSAVEDNDNPWSLGKFSASSGSNSELISPEDFEDDSFNLHTNRENVTTLHKSPKDSNPSQGYYQDTMSSLVDHNISDENYDGYDGNPPGENGDIVQLGLNGKLLDYQSPNGKVFVNLKPRIRLDGSIPIDHQLIIRFVAQIKNEDHDLVIEKLVDSVS
jgi:hypothetical protein